MQVRINILKIKTILLFLISGLPGCCLIFGALKLRLSLILTFGFLIFYIIFAFKKFLKEIFQTFINNKYSRFLLLWLGWCFITGIIACIFGHYNFGKFLYYFIFHGVLLVCVPYYLAFNIIQNTPTNKIIKYYYIFLICIYTLGLINFIFVHSGNSFLQTFFDYTLTNTRQQTIYSECLRTKSTFVEPSFFANFICLHLPLLYEFSRNKYKIFESKNLNLFSKNLMIPIAWFLIVSTYSPIFLIFGVLLTIIYFASSINLKRFFNIQNLVILALLIIFSILIGLVVNISGVINIDISETFLKRITKTINNLSSFEAFIQAEPSLATRIVSMINQFIIGMHNPIFGVGYGNLSGVLDSQLLKSPVMLTYELFDVIKDGTSVVNVFIFWTTLAETGFIGLILFYLFLFVIIKQGLKLLTYMRGKTKLFFKSLCWGVCFFTAVSIYDGEFATHILMIIGFIAGYGVCLSRNVKNN